MEQEIRYRVVKQAASPSISIQQLAEYRNCYLGVSLNNPFFTGRHLELFLTWITNHFDHCTVIIVDYLHRINESIQYGKSEEDAILSAMTKGDEILKVIQTAIDKQSNNKFKVYRWKDYIDEYPNVFNTKRKLVEYFNTNSKFKESVTESSADYINRLIRNGDNPYFSVKTAIEYSHEYLIEELAVFNNLIKQGNTVQVYPGTQLKIFKEFTSHVFDDLELELTNGIYINLDIKKRRK